MENSSLKQKVDLILCRRLRSQVIRYIFYLLFLLMALLSIKMTIIDDMDWKRIGTIKNVLKAIGQFVPPDISVFQYLFVPTVETIMIASIGTILAIFLAIPVSWFAAQNITPSLLIAYPIGRSIIMISRSVHEVIWGLIFVSAVGLGAFPGILAIAIRSIGFISKLTAEAIEDVNPDQIDAIKAVGGNRIQIICYGIIPQILPIYIGNAINLWDINIRRSTILGLVGAGGLGLTFERQLLMYNYKGATTVIIAALFLIAVGEVVSYYARKTIV